MILPAQKRLVVSLISLSAAGLVAIASSENYRGEAYIPVPGDVPTIGFGATAGVQLGDTTTPPRALVRLLADADTHAQAVKRCAPVPLYQREFDVYVSFAYNVGTSAFCASTLAKRLNAGDYAGACAELKRWNKAGGRVVPGLVARREREYRKCIGGEAA